MQKSLIFKKFSKTEMNLMKQQGCWNKQQNTSQQRKDVLQQRILTTFSPLD